MDTEGWFTLPLLNARVPMPPKDLAFALVTIILFLPVIVLCQTLVPFNKNPYKSKKA